MQLKTHPKEPNDGEINELQTSKSVAGRIFRGSSKLERLKKTAAISDTPSAQLMKYILDKKGPVKKHRNTSPL